MNVPSTKPPLPSATIAAAREWIDSRILPALWETLRKDAQDNFTGAANFCMEIAFAAGAEWQRKQVRLRMVMDEMQAADIDPQDEPFGFDIKEE